MDEIRNVNIRRFEESDASEVSQLIVENLILVNVRDYGEAAVGQLADSYSPALLKQYAQSGQIYVAIEGSDLVVIVGLSQDRVRIVFVRVDHHRQGIGRMMMEYLEGSARQQGLASLHLYAATSAVGFYQKLGYLPVEEKEETVGDSRMKMVVMEKVLD